MSRINLPVGYELAGGEAELGDIFSDAWDEAKYVANSNAAYTAKSEAYQERIDAVQAATGVKLFHPMKVLGSELEKYGYERTTLDAAPSPEEFFAQRLDELAKEQPQHLDVIRPDRSLLDDAYEKARGAEERFNTRFNSRDDFWRWGAAFAGGAAASLRDPLQLATLALGFGPGAARTVAGRIAATAGREMAINAGAEAALQPFALRWADEAGLNYGLDDAARNVAFAAGLGGIFGVAGRSTVEAVDAIRGRAVQRAQAESTDLTDGETAAPAVSADLDRQVEEIGRRNEAHAALSDAAVRAAEDPRQGPDLVRRRGEIAADFPEQLDLPLAPRFGRLGDDVPTLPRPDLEARLGAALPDAVTARPLADFVDEQPGPLREARLEALGRHADKVSGVSSFGPQFKGLEWREAVELLDRMKGGEATGVLSHPALGEVDLFFDPASGTPTPSKLMTKHPEVVNDWFAADFAGMEVISATANRVELGDGKLFAAVRLDYDGRAKKWLLTAFEPREGTAAFLKVQRATRSTWRGGREGDAGSSPALQDEYSAAAALQQEAADLFGPQAGSHRFDLEKDAEAQTQMLARTQDEIAREAAERGEEPEFTFGAGDGAPERKTLSQALEEARATNDWADVVDACKPWRFL